MDRLSGDSRPPIRSGRTETKWVPPRSSTGTPFPARKTPQDRQRNPRRRQTAIPRGTPISRLHDSPPSSNGLSRSHRERGMTGLVEGEQRDTAPLDEGGLRPRRPEHSIVKDHHSDIAIAGLAARAPRTEGATVSQAPHPTSSR